MSKKCSYCEWLQTVQDRVEDDFEADINQCTCDFDVTKAVNIAVGCIMSSGMTIGEKQVVIDAIRKLEIEHELYRDIVDSCNCDHNES